MPACPTIGDSSSLEHRCVHTPRSSVRRFYPSSTFSRAIFSELSTDEILATPIHLCLSSSPRRGCLATYPFKICIIWNKTVAVPLVPARFCNSVCDWSHKTEFSVIRVAGVRTRIKSHKSNHDSCDFWLPCSKFSTQTPYHVPKSDPDQHFYNHEHQILSKQLYPVFFFHLWTSTETKRRRIVASRIVLLTPIPYFKVRPLWTEAHDWFYISNTPSHVRVLGLETWTTHKTTLLVLKFNFF